MKLPTGPGWPTIHGVMVVGFFALTFDILHMIEKNPALLANASFMQFVQSLAAGGILLAASAYFQMPHRPESGGGGGTGDGSTTVNVERPATVEVTTPPKP